MLELRDREEVYACELGFFVGGSGLAFEELVDFDICVEEF